MRRNIKFEDKIKYNHLINLGCQNKACNQKGKKICAGHKLTCKWYEEPGNLDLMINTKSII
ncbi:MAG: hypothetical protein ACFFDF_03890 [Candidatus Odinarchaeota archaeon]